MSVFLRIAQAQATVVLQAPAPIAGAPGTTPGWIRGLIDFTEGNSSNYYTIPTTGGAAPASWIMAGGSWNDGGVWDDASTWNG